MFLLFFFFCGFFFFFVDFEAILFLSLNYYAGKAEFVLHMHSCHVTS